MEQYEAIREREREQLEELEAARRESRGATEAFQAVQQARYDAFTAAFEHVARRIDPIYKVGGLGVGSGAEGGMVGGRAGWLAGWLGAFAGGLGAGKRGRGEVLLMAAGAAADPPSAAPATLSLNCRPCPAASLCRS